MPSILEDPDGEEAGAWGKRGVGCQPEAFHSVCASHKRRCQVRSIPWPFRVDQKHLFAGFLRNRFQKTVVGAAKVTASVSLVCSD